MNRCSCLFDVSPTNSCPSCPFLTSAWTFTVDVQNNYMFHAIVQLYKDEATFIQANANQQQNHFLLFSSM